LVLQHIRKTVPVAQSTTARPTHTKPYAP
jgi:hypothetical protein